MEIEVRWVESLDELSWVNAQYKKIDFLVSKWGKDRVALAFIEGKKAGVGRLVPLENGDYELGGIFVLPEFRKRGIAKQIVSFLVENAPTGKSIYCLPFEHLGDFYRSFSFKNALPDNTAPSDVRKKHSWCLASYSDNVLFMVIRK